MERSRLHSEHDDVSPAGATPPDDPVMETQAATWFVRRQGEVSEKDERAFHDWLAQSAAHRLAYEQIAGVWHELDAMPQHEVERLRAAYSQPAVREGKRPALASPGRRAFVPRFALAGTAFALAGGGAIAWNWWWQSSPTFTQAWQTRRGEFQTVSLPDGSTVELDTETHVEARLFRHRREVRVVRGQAMFTVKSDPDCPFDVLARDVKVTVVGTRFSVRCTDTGLEHGNVRVEVEEGCVRVASARPDGGGQRVVELVAGQMVATDADGLLGAISAIAPAEVAPWRQGRVTFNDTTLLRALQEFERYEAMNVVVDDPAVGAMRLTGSFDIGQASRFVRALPRVLPVRVRARGRLLEIVRAT